MTGRAHRGAVDGPSARAEGSCGILTRAHRFDIPAEPGSPRPKGTWSVKDSLAGFRLAASCGGDRAGRILLTEALWPLLGNGAMELRLLAENGLVTAYLLLRCTSSEARTSREQCVKLMRAFRTLAGATLPGWSFEPLDRASLRSALEPFPVGAGGDLVRQRLEATLNEEPVALVPAPFVLDHERIGLLTECLALARCSMVSIAAAPAPLDWPTRSQLEARLARVEGTLITEGFGLSVVERRPPLSRLEAVAAALRLRLHQPESTGRLRVSIAAAEEPSPSLLAAVQSLGGEGRPLEYLPATESSDLDVFRSNLRSLRIDEWGAGTGAGPADAASRNLACLQEVALAMQLPVADDRMPLAARSSEPAPRPAPMSVPAAGAVVGWNACRRRTVALPECDRDRHVYLVGQTGTGKSTLMLNLALEDIRRGAGVCVVDPHGDLVDDILDRFPEKRADDLILVDPSDPRPVGINLLDARDGAEQDFCIQEVISLMYRVYDPGHTGIMGPRWEHWFRMAGLTAMADPEGGTLLEIPRLFTDDLFLAKKLRHVEDPMVRWFWLREIGGTSDFHKSEMLGWFVGKFGAFLANRAMRDIVGQRGSSFRMREVLDESKVMLVKLSRGVLGEVNSMWLGTILLAKLQMAAMGRADVAPEERTRFGLYVDEFQNFSLSSFDAMVSEARKYGLALTIANQHFTQVPERIRGAVLGNVGTLGMFRLGVSDAIEIARELEDCSPDELTRLANHQCMLRLAVEGRVMPIFDVHTLPAPSERTDREAVRRMRELATMRYGRPRDVVEAEVLACYAS